MRLTFLVVSFFIVCASMTGCASVFNPYKDEFACDETYKGRCTNVQRAYSESVNDIDSRKIAEAQEKCREEGGKCGEETENPMTGSGSGASFPAREFYQSKQFMMLSGLMDDPQTPLVAPPEVVRVLILSYTTDNNSMNAMMGYRHAYFIAAPPKFILSTFKDRSN